MLGVLLVIGIIVAAERMGALIWWLAEREAKRSL